MYFTTALIITLFEASVLGAPVTPSPHFMLPGNSTAYTIPNASNLTFNTTTHAATQDGADGNSPQPHDKFNAIIGIILGGTIGTALIVWVGFLRIKP
ncbi:hypothetical protein F5Y03DRAFT_392684 [Xylaria venustula]|nr:hypothetical protein F5Y03DRAFT_392684 [Xylaria venustula]